MSESATLAVLGMVILGTLVSTVVSLTLMFVVMLVAAGTGITLHILFGSLS